MSDVTSRAELIEYCYRQLGYPLVEIDVTDDQADDAVDRAIAYFRDYYHDGIEKVYLKHQIVDADVTNKYITLPDLIFGVNRVFPANSGGATGATSIFDLQYQLRMNDLRDLTSTSMVYYVQSMQHIALLDNILNTQKQFRWNRLTNKLHIDQNWEQKMVVGQYILLDCYMALDPALAPKFWNIRTFKDYTTAIMKRQWGSNIKKFTGITLPGNVTLDGQALYEEGKAEMDEIEGETMTKLAPLEFYVG